MEEKYVFVQPFGNEEGTIKEGTELYLFRGQVYMNGGLVMPSYQKFLKNFIENEELSKQYLVKIKLIKDKV